jgi:hypothetical protein
MKRRPGGSCYDLLTGNSERLHKDVIACVEKEFPGFKLRDDWGGNYFSRDYWDMELVREDKL